MHWPIEGEAFEALLGRFFEGIAEVLGDDPTSTWAVVGVRSRGDVLAERLAGTPIGEAFGGRVGRLDITLYRDDLTELGSQAVVRSTDVPFAIDGLDVVLIDDVLMTGRSVRAALQSLTDLGRPRRVWLAVLVDRGGRELPIRPDVVGLDMTGEATGLVSVAVREVDGRDAITCAEAGDE
ncbi:MAG: bifunctional pyr operon transcriptional regulator/uracil phosphoribosyltransferase PyrR [Planctomycetota bacterium]